MIETTNKVMRAASHYFFDDSPTTEHGDSTVEPDFGLPCGQDCLEQIFETLDNQNVVSELIDMHKTREERSVAVLNFGEVVLGGNHADALKYNVEDMYEFDMDFMVNKCRVRTRSLPARFDILHEGYMDPYLHSSARSVCSHAEASSGSCTPLNLHRNNLLPETPPKTLRQRSTCSMLTRQDSKAVVARCKDTMQDKLSRVKQWRKAGLPPVRRIKPSVQKELLVPRPFDAAVPQSSLRWVEIARRGVPQGSFVKFTDPRQHISPKDAAAFPELPPAQTPRTYAARAPIRKAMNDSNQQNRHTPRGNIQPGPGPAKKSIAPVTPRTESRKGKGCHPASPSHPNHKAAVWNGGVPTLTPRSKGKGFNARHQTPQKESAEARGWSRSLTPRDGKKGKSKGKAWTPRDRKWTPCASGPTSKSANVWNEDDFPMLSPRSEAKTSSCHPMSPAVVTSTDSLTAKIPKLTLPGSAYA